MEIREVPWGIANNFGEYIEINENLKFYPKLHDAVLAHELAHSNANGFTKEDFLLDLAPTNISYMALMKFMVKHPKSFLQFAPFYKQGKTFFYDINMCIAWGVMAGVISLVVYLALH